MKQIKKFALADGGVPFDDWIDELEINVPAKIRAYIDRVAMGGAQQNVKRLKNADGMLELRIDTGPGYRVYYGHVGTSIMLLLIGGIKKSQTRDIKLAKEYWRVCRA